MTPATKTIQALLGGPLNRAGMIAVRQALTEAERRWMGCAPLGKTRTMYAEVIRRLRARADEQSAELARQEQERRIRQARANERRVEGRARLAALRDAKDNESHWQRVARRAEIEEARVHAAVWLDALTEHRAAVVTHAKVSDVDWQSHVRPTTSLEQLVADHETRYRVWSFDPDNQFTWSREWHCSTVVRPIEYHRELIGTHGALYALALTAYRLEYPTARGDRAVVFRTDSDRNGGRLQTGRYVCRYCGVWSVAGRIGVPPNHHEHTDTCALEYLAGLRPGVAPGAAPTPTEQVEQETRYQAGDHEQEH